MRNSRRHRKKLAKKKALASSELSGPQSPKADSESDAETAVQDGHEPQGEEGLEEHPAESGGNGFRSHPFDPDSDPDPAPEPEPDPEPDPQAASQPDPVEDPGPVPAPLPGAGGPTRISVLEAMSWHKWTVLFFVLLGAAGGVALALTSDPEYSTDARLNVDFTSQSPGSLPGSLTAARALTDSYSRAIDSDAVVRDIARRTGMEGDEVAELVSASPIPDSTVVRIDATGDSAAGAERLADDASAALIKYVNELDSPDADLSQALVAKFRTAADRYDQLAEEQRELKELGKEAEVEAHEVEIEAQVALLKREALSQRYAEAQQGYVADLVKLESASAAESNQASLLQLYGGVGIAVGLLLAAVVASIRANRF